MGHCCWSSGFSDAEHCPLPQSSVCLLNMPSHKGGIWCGRYQSMHYDTPYL